ncbi:hypothetical protein [Vibrio sinensis]|uniref:hypothetical protein n=1 Tax=Vibrio sinensis TaxID=2302434 RepID=UPI001402BF6B|nr:hypothetical protein [Vibrio sinensis]
MKIALIAAIVVQIIIAILNDGLWRSVAEFTAFVLLIVLVLLYRQERGLQKT